eukprot:885_1
MISHLLVIVLLFYGRFSQVIGDELLKDEINLTHNKNNYIIPLSCWHNAKQRFSIGNKGVWGPKLWHSLHCTALNYPINPSENDRINYKSFYLNVDNLIPCKLCANHYKHNVINFDLDKYLDTPNNLFKFTVDIHNLVNKQLGKQSMSVEHALQIHQTTCNQCIETPHNLEDLINGLKPHHKNKQNTQQDSLLSIALYGFLWRIAFFALGLIVATILLFAYRFWMERTQIRKKKE